MAASATQGISNVVDVYDTGNGPGRRPRCHSALLIASAAGGKVVWGGGSTATGPSNAVDIYDTASNTWSTASSEQSCDRHCRCAQVGLEDLFRRRFSHGWLHQFDRHLRHINQFLVKSYAVACPRFCCRRGRKATERFSLQADSSSGATTTRSISMTVQLTPGRPARYPSDDRLFESRLTGGKILFGRRRRRRWDIEQSR